MLYCYYFTREIVNDAYNIDNPALVDGDGNIIHLATEVEAVIPNEKFVLRCNGPEAKFIFENKLTVEQQTALGVTVQAYKNNIG